VSERLGLFVQVDDARPSLRRYLDDTPEPPVLIYAQTPGTKKKRRPRRGAWSAKSLHEQQHRPWLTYIRPGEHLQLFVSNRKHDNEKTGNEETRTQHWPPPRSVTLADLRPERRWGPERKPTPYLLFGKPCTRWRVAESKPWLWTPAPPGHVWSSCGRWAGGRWWDPRHGRGTMKTTSIAPAAAHAVRATPPEISSTGGWARRAPAIGAANDRAQLSARPGAAETKTVTRDRSSADGSAGYCPARSGRADALDPTARTIESTAASS
jgi:hypothetical protein